MTSPITRCENPPLITTGEAAALLGLSERYVDILIDQGDIAVKQIGKRTFISRNSLLRFVAAV
jgi:excisionase family DNA binding protein